MLGVSAQLKTLASWYVDKTFFRMYFFFPPIYLLVLYYIVIWVLNLLCEIFNLEIVTVSIAVSLVYGLIIAQFLKYFSIDISTIFTIGFVVMQIIYKIY